jgi:hypothetical protein
MTSAFLMKFHLIHYLSLLSVICDHLNNAILLTFREARMALNRQLCIDSALGWQTYPHALRPKFHSKNSGF